MSVDGKFIVKPHDVNGISDMSVPKRDPDRNFEKMCFHERLLPREKNK